LRGGIPLGVALGYNPIQVFLVAVLANILVYFPIRWMLDIIGKVVLRLSFVRNARDRGQRMVSKYGKIGLALLVAIPLPLTGVYTATLASWSLKYSYRETILPIAVGVIIAGCIVTAMSLGVFAWVKS
jgi:uncharacterized membrane protein